MGKKRCLNYFTQTPFTVKDAESGFEPGQKLFFGPLRHGVSAKNLYNNSKRQTLTFIGTWVWPERVNLYSRQTMVLPRETKNIRRIYFLYHKTNQMHQLSQIYSGIKFYMFGAAPLPIIRSLFTVHSALVYVIQVFGQLSSRTRMEHPGPARKLYDIYHCCVYSE